MSLFKWQQTQRKKNEIDASNWDDTIEIHFATQFSHRQPDSASTE